MVNLIPLLSRYKKIKDFESDVAVFRTNTPHRAPFAYLHILFKPAPEELQRVRCSQLRIPPSLADFYSHHNGAELFGGTIRIFGFLSDHYLLNRRDWRNLPPFNILDLNEQHRDELGSRNLIAFADYKVDGSLVCVERDSGRIECLVEENFRKVRQTWPDFDNWIQEEVSRLSLHFDELGHCSVEHNKLLPGSDPKTTT